MKRLINRIHHRDTRHVLPRLAEESVRLVHTSPPYNIGRPYAGYEDRRGMETYLELIREVVGELYRVLTPGGSLFWQSGYTQSKNGTIIPIDHLTWPLFQAAGFELWDRVIWRYWGGMAFKRKWTNKHETLLWWVKPGADPYFDVFPVREETKERDPRNNLFGRNPGNVWEVERVAYGSRDQTTHIAVFPEEVSDRLVLSCTRPGDICLDPFSGSGTLCTVARARGRQYIGTELLKPYYEDSVDRLSQHQESSHDEILSTLIKSIALRKGGNVSVPFLAERLQGLAEIDLWTGLDDVSERFRDALSLGDRGSNGNGRVPKNRKRELWTKLHDFFADPTGMAPMQIADRAHIASFRIARRFNGALRAHYAARWLSWLRSELEGGSLSETLTRVIRTESASYTRRGSAVTVSPQHPRVLPVVAPSSRPSPDAVGQGLMSFSR